MLFIVTCVDPFPTFYIFWVFILSFTFRFYKNHCKFTLFYPGNTLTSIHYKNLVYLNILSKLYYWCYSFYIAFPITGLCWFLWFLSFKFYLKITSFVTLLYSKIKLYMTFFFFAEKTLRLHVTCVAVQIYFSVWSIPFSIFWRIGLVLNFWGIYVSLKSLFFFSFKR